jgi:hypothetical protein
MFLQNFGSALPNYSVSPVRLLCTIFSQLYDKNLILIYVENGGLPYNHSQIKRIVYGRFPEN